MADFNRALGLPTNVLTLLWSRICGPQVMTLRMLQSARPG
jgi:hypothetical protein